MAQASDPTTIIEQLQQLCQRDLSLDGDAAARKEALGLSRKLTTALQHPVSAATDMIYTPITASAVRIAVNMDLFSAIMASNEPTTTLTLASICKAEELLVSRLLRLLASIGFVEEAGRELWSATAITAAMAKPEIMAGWRVIWDFLDFGALHSPQYLLESGHKLPIEPTDGIAQYTFQTKYSSFEYLARKRPDRWQDFNLFMGNTMGARSYWVDWFPVKSHLLSGAHSDTALLVDVGGGKGHDMQAFAEAFPEATGRIVLQDLPQALAAIPSGGLNPKIECQVQDFFMPNAEKGARAYLMHHVIHDWSEKYCLQILAHIKEAMAPGYSKLLLHELILADRHPTTYQTTWDIAMMNVNGGMERNQEQWEDLIRKAGLKVVKFWHGPDGEDADGIVEVVKEE